VIQEKNISEAFDQLQSDLLTLHKLVFSYNKPLMEGDIRLASAILRKWLNENKLSRLCKLIGVKPTFNIIDNEKIVRQINSNNSIIFFITGGIKFNGKTIAFPYESNSCDLTKGLKLAEPVQKIVSLNDFLSQKRIFYKNVFFTNQEIIKFTANKLGGVHCDFSIDNKNSTLWEFSEYVSFGGPKNLAERGKIGEIHLEVEPNAIEALSALHIEIISSSASLINVLFDDSPVMKLEVKKNLFSKIKRKKEKSIE